MTFYYEEDTYGSYSEYSDEIMCSNRVVEHEVDYCDAEDVVLEMIAKEVVNKHCKDYLPKNKREMERVVVKGLRKLITDFEIELNLDNYYEELKDYYQDKIGD